MDDLARWISEQLDDDEQAAFAWPRDQHVWEARPGTVQVQRSLEWDGAVCVEGNSEFGWERIKVARDEDPTLTAHIAVHDPARVLREIDAKRQTLAYVKYELEDHGADNPWWYADKLIPILKQMALAYADRPGYRDEWRP